MSVSTESGISSINGIESVTPNTFDSIESIQGSIMNIQSLMELLRNLKANHSLNSKEINEELLKSDLQTIASRTNIMRTALDEKESIDQEIKEKTRKVCQLLVKYEGICSSIEITPRDKDIDRLLYKINVMRTVTQVLLSGYAASYNLGLSDALVLLEISRHVSDSRSLKYFRDKLESRH